MQSAIETEVDRHQEETSEAARQVVEVEGGLTCQTGTISARIVEAGGLQNTARSVLPKGRNATYAKDRGILLECVKVQNRV